MIDGARRTIDLEEFYLSTWPGESLDDVVRALGAAAARGVRVRLLLDAGFHKTYPQPADSLGALPNVTVRTIDFHRVAGGVQHAKYFLVDGEQTFLGSQNLDWRALTHIHEMGVRIRDTTTTRAFTRVFEDDWAIAGGGAADGPPPAFGTEPDGVRLPVRLANAPGDTVSLWWSMNPRGSLPDSTRWDRDAVVRAIDGARGEVVAQVLTYSTGSRDETDDTIDRALRAAAARGVRVRLLVSDWMKGRSSMRALTELARVPGITVRLSTVPEWSRAYIPFARVEHCKYMVVDRRVVWVGTSNWEPDYFHSSRNVAVTLENARLAQAARKVFETSWAAPTATRVTPASRFAAKPYRDTPPPGRSVYGR
jgi:phosphatidylserine/phosphatidylglycerophosphate/cardiolipin synthase-like enzyme